MTQSYALHKSDPPSLRDRVRANARAFIDRLPVTKSWRIEIKELRKDRSSAQNNALWGVAYPVLSEATGYTPDELHEVLCRKFFGTVGVEVLGETVTRPRRTTTHDENGKRDVIDTVTFAQFYERAQQLGAELGIDIPDPDPFWSEA